MNEMTEFHKRAAALGVVKMLSGTSFSICDLDAIAKVMGREMWMAGKDYNALRTLHCVSWADMGPELARQTREKCLELLGLPAQIVDEIKPVQPTKEPAHEPARRLRLAFWR